MSNAIDETLVDQVVLALDKRLDAERFGPIYKRGGLRNFTQPEKTVLLACWAMGIIQNGGFQFFYEGATNVDEVADAYECFGYHEAAEACRKSSSIFPNRVPPEEAHQRLQVLSSYQGHSNEFLRPLNEAVWKAGDADFEGAVASYIRLHTSEFKDVLQAPEENQYPKPT